MPSNEVVVNGRDRFTFSDSKMEVIMNILRGMADSIATEKDQEGRYNG